jgi:hypothetical protein
MEMLLFITQKGDLLAVSRRIKYAADISFGTEYGRAVISDPSSY